MKLGPCLLDKGQGVLDVLRLVGQAEVAEYLRAVHHPQRVNLFLQSLVVKVFVHPDDGFPILIAPSSGLEGPAQGLLL